MADFLDPLRIPVKKKTDTRFYLLVAALLLFRTFVYTSFRIPSGSMMPTLLVGDHVGTSKSRYGWTKYSFLFSGYIDYFSGRIGNLKIKRGDIAVFAYPLDTRMDYVKRVVGMPGDKVEMRQGYLYINDQKVPLEKTEENFQGFDGEEQIAGTVYKQTLPGENNGEPGKTHLVLKQKPFGKGRLDDMAPITISPHHYFVMGDNRDGSADSRILDGLGEVPEKYFIGPGKILLFSWDMKTWWDILRFWEIPFKIRWNRLFKLLD